jgi:hypothetical protein
MTDLENILGELAAARAYYEDLQAAGAPFDERARARSTLHELRARADRARSHGTGRI